ncbi:phosphotransferase [Peribacillus asahii]|uniref:phosphotransferase n=1 Tax=Peribacillus asahii TaxID=228899 RepID=UPI0037F7F744
MTFSRNHSFKNRLFSKVKALKSRPERMKRLQGDVYLLTFKNHPPLILKGFTSREKWYRQQVFTSLLKQKGFDRTYSMYSEPEPFQLDGMWYSFIEFLPPSANKFNFANESNRKEGAQLLEAFHNSADQISLPSVPVYNQLNKWRDRLALFRQNVPYIREHIPESILKEWIAWAEWSLKGLETYQKEINQETNTIIHGDCAHHNFLRKEDGTLALIDFDLIAKAPRMIDYLQYANRILPHLDNPSKDIWKYQQIAAYKKNPAFLYALAYPSDIFREWNLLFKTRFRIDHVWKITVEDFEKRMELNKQLAQLVSK